LYDNAYLSNWLQFDYYGIIITSMSAYPQYNAFNFCAMNFGDETKTNIGIVGNNKIIINSLFTITPIPDPTIYVNDGSQLYDFLNSDREQCIITNDIGVNFNLTSSNGIKTILSDNLIKITKI